jgi:hypothetical protein
MSYTQCTQQGQLIAHDLKRLATPKGGGLLGHFTAWLPASDAHIRLRHRGRDRSGGDWLRPPQYRRPTLEGEKRNAPVVIAGSTRIESAFLAAALRAVQRLARQGSVL